MLSQECQAIAKKNILFLIMEMGVLCINRYIFLCLTVLCFVNSVSPDFQCFPTASITDSVQKWYLHIPAVS